jgi:hypothetical protein
VDDVAIPVERSRGPILMIPAEDDQLWASSTITEIAERRLRRTKFPHFHERVRRPPAILSRSFSLTFAISTARFTACRPASRHERYLELWRAAQARDPDEP